MAAAKLGEAEIFQSKISELFPSFLVGCCLRKKQSFEKRVSSRAEPSRVDGWALTPFEPIWSHFMSSLIMVWIQLAQLIGLSSSFEILRLYPSWLVCFSFSPHQSEMLSFREWIQHYARNKFSSFFFLTRNIKLWQGPHMLLFGFGAPTSCSHLRF